MAADIVDAMLEEFKAVFPNASAEVLQHIEEKIRTEYGGDECYIAKKKIKSTQKQNAVTDYLGGKPVSQIEKDQGLSRRTLYRHLKK